MVHKILSIFVMVFLSASMSFALEYQGEDVLEEPHPFLKGLNLYLDDNTPIRMGVKLILSERYVNIYNKEQVRGGYSTADTVYIVEYLTPNQILGYIDNGCKALGVGDDYTFRQVRITNCKDCSNIYEKILLYNQVKCGRELQSSLIVTGTHTMIKGYKVYGTNVNPPPPAKKPLSEIVYGK